MGLTHGQHYAIIRIDKIKKGLASTMKPCKKTNMLLCLTAIAASVTLPQSVAAGDSITARDESTIAVDLREDVCRAVSPGSIGYSPRWGGVTNSGAYVVIEKVVRADRYDAATNTLATLAADAEGVCPFVVGDGDEHCMRLIHRVYSAGGVEMGEALIRDVSFGVRSAAGAVFVADSRTNSLQLAARERKSVDLAYSTAWATNAAGVTISALRLSGKGGVPVATNGIFAAASSAEGVARLPLIDMGWWRLLYNASDGEEGTLLEYLTGEFKVSGGTILSVW